MSLATQSMTRIQPSPPVFPIPEPPVLPRPIKPVESIPPLQNGDRLSRAEFGRRYGLQPGIKKAELIEGVVHMPSPVKFSKHGQPHAALMGWLAVYAAATPGVQIGDNATVILDVDNEVQPDSLLRLEPELGGKSCVNEADYLEGPPELIVEIAASSAAYDLHNKLHVYRRSGVQEYLVLQAYEQRIDWFELVEGTYQSIQPNEEGVLHSRVFPGLWLKAQAVWASDLAGVLAILQAGLDSKAHQTFVDSLQASGEAE